jgi:HK97 family phage portal protein
MGKKGRTQRALEKRDALPRAVSERALYNYVSTYAITPGAYPLTVVEAAGVSAVRRCVTLIANAIAGQRWTEWDGREPVDPVSRLVKRPAASMSRREWVWRVVSQMALQDISYLRMIGGVDDEGTPGSLLPLPSEAIAPAGYVDPYGVFAPTQYTISGVPGTISGEEIVLVRSAFWPGVPLYLQGILQMARNAMTQAWASDVYGSRYWLAGGHPTTVLTSDQELTNPQAEDIGNRWVNRRSMGPDFPAVLGKGTHAEGWGADVSNAVAIEARREIVVEIANLFGVPARYVNVVPTGNSQTYSNLNDEALSLERFTLSGFVDPIQDVITDLLPDERAMLIDMTRLTRASQEARFRAWAIATGSKPWMMPSEVRYEEGLQPSEEIDTFEEARTVGAQAFADNAEKPAEPVAVEE